MIRVAPALNLHLVVGTVLLIDADGQQSFLTTGQARQMAKCLTSAADEADAIAELERAEPGRGQLMIGRAGHA